MSSRRSMARSFSENGRSSSENGEDAIVPSVRTENRNYLASVRPENRSTLCSVMAHLTEETQPLFETTLKSKAVSESCDVKFTCVVSGYPAPELTWYKEDMELDRYCGLPKYEVFRNGQIHSLLIYNCTEEDAAIYQASARNSKGIVSCSGVLEVGTMNEFKIHQRFFAKLKKRADGKRKELEESRRRGKENVLRPVSPDRSQRKRRSPGEVASSSGSPQLNGEDTSSACAQEAEAKARLLDGSVGIMGQPAAVAETPNGFPAKTWAKNSADQSEEAVRENGTQAHPIISETVEMIPMAQPIKEPLVKKKIKISNGVGSDNGKAGQGSGCEAGTVDGGMSLAQYLAESLQSESLQSEISEDTQNSAQLEEVMDLDTSVDQTETEKAKKKAKHQTVHGTNITEPKAEALAVVQKEPEPSHAPSPFSSIYFSLRDIFFGSRSGDEAADENVVGREEEDFPVYQSVPSPDPLRACQQESQTEPKDYRKLTGDIKLMEVDGLPEDTHLKGSPSQINQTPQPQDDSLLLGRLDSVGHAHEPTVLRRSSESRTLENEECHESRAVLHKLLHAVDNVQIPAGKTSSNPKISAPLLPCEVVKDHVRRERDGAPVGEDPALNGAGVFTSAGERASADSKTLLNRGQSASSEWTLNTTPHSTGSDGGGAQPLRDLRKSDLQSKRDEEDTSINSTPARITVDHEKEGNLHVNESIEESQDGIMEGQETTASIGKRKPAMKGTDITVSIVQTNKTICILETPMTVESKPPDAMLNVLEVKTLASQMKDDHESLNPASFVRGVSHADKPNLVPEIQVLESETEDIMQMPLSLAGKSSVSNHYSSPVHADKATEVIENNAMVTHSVPVVTPIQQNDETHSPKEMQGITQQDPEARSGNEKASEKSINETDADTVQAINVHFKDENVISKTDFDQRNQATPQAPVIPSISVTCVNTTPENNPISEGETESLAVMLKGVTGDVGVDKSIVSPTFEGIKKSTSDLCDTEKVIDAPDLPSEEHDPYLDQILSHVSITKPDKKKPKEFRGDSEILVDRPQRENSTNEKLSLTSPEAPLLSPTTLRRFDTKIVTNLESHGLMAVPEIRVDSTPSGYEDTTEKNTPPIVPSCDSSPKLTRRDSLTLIPSATPEELASGARRKIFIPKAKGEGEDLAAQEEAGTPEVQAKKDEAPKKRQLSQEQDLTCPHMELNPSPGQSNMLNPSPGQSNMLNPSPGQSNMLNPSPGQSNMLNLSPGQSNMLNLSPGQSNMLNLSPGQSNMLNLSPGQSNMLNLSPGQSNMLNLSPGQSQRSVLQAPTVPKTPPTERRSPLVSRKKTTLEVPKCHEEPAVENETTKILVKDKLNPFKAPQVIRKIRGEPFSDASGHLKLWCQFFNVLSDSTIKWSRDEVEIAEMERRAGDESPVALAIVQASIRDCGVYGCSIKNEYGTDSTDFLLSADILSEFFLREDLEVGEEIEMTQMLSTKGLTEPGYMGDKFFGRVMTEEMHLGEGYTHKASRVKAIYGLEPIFESGSTCILKVSNPITYRIQEDRNLMERNLEITKLECKIQNMARDYCKIFSAEARAIENFGPVLEVIPLHLMYRPANCIPYATVEADLNGVFLKYCRMDENGRLVMRNTSEVEQKCCAFQHWIHQWTNGNLLVSRLEGVDLKITNVRIATKTKGYQGLSENGSPEVLEQFLAHHQCNYYCGLLGMRPLKTSDSQQTKTKVSRSPMLNRKMGSGSSSPQMLRKGSGSPQTPRKGSGSPKVVRKSDPGDPKSPPKHKTVEMPKVVRMR